MQDWTGQRDLRPLTPEEWFTLGHGVQGGASQAQGLWIPHETQHSWFLWTPPPAAADVAVEELLISRHKRTQLNHVFIVPHLSTHLCRRNCTRSVI